MPTFKGKGLRWSTAGHSFTAGVVSGTDTAFWERWGFKRTAQNYVLKDDSAARAGEVYFDPIRTYTCTVVIYGTSISAAEASVDKWGLAPGLKMVAVDSKGTLLDGGAKNAAVTPATIANATGNYILDDSEIVAEKEGAVVAVLTMHASDEADISTSIDT